MKNTDQQINATDNDLCTCQTFILPVLLHSSETWTTLATDIKCMPRRILHEMLMTNSQHSVACLHMEHGLSPLRDVIIKRCNAFFRHVARLPDDIPPAHQVLRCLINTLGKINDHSWKCSGHSLTSGWIRHRWTSIFYLPCYVQIHRQSGSFGAT